MRSVAERKKKYTPKYYRGLKLKRNLKWKDVPFVCIQCGIVFYVSTVKPQALPVNCTQKCRNKAFDPNIGAILSAHVLNVDWKKVERLIVSGKTGPEICKTIGIALVTLHKYVKRKMGVKVLDRMISSGKKRRLEGQRLAYTAK